MRAIAKQRAKRWFKDRFGHHKIPHAPTADELYGGPRAFSGYQTQASQYDPQLLAAQYGVLGRDQQIMANGRTAADAQMENQALTQSQQATAAERMAAVQQANARGMHLYAGLGYSDTSFFMHSYGLDRPQAKPAEAGRALRVRIRNDRHIVTIHYSTDGRTWQRYDRGMEVSGYHHNVAYEFLSLRRAQRGARRQRSCSKMSAAR